jgi:hypothetical protein
MGTPLLRPKIFEAYSVWQRRVIVGENYRQPARFSQPEQLLTSRLQAASAFAGSGRALRRPLSTSVYSR